MRHRLFYTMVLLTLALLLPAVMLVSVSMTANARLLGLSFIAFWAAAVAAGFAWLQRKPRKITIVSFAAPITLALLLLTLVYALTPNGWPLPGACVRQVYLNGGAYRRGSPANLVPEVDQFNFGLALLPRLGLYLDRSQRGRVRGLFQSVYREMEASPEFHSLGSNMNFAYRELFFADFDAGHAYVYIPRARPEPSAEKMPVILFLHGSLGNFKGYTWVLKELADRRHCAIMAPSFGLGNWGRQGGAEAVERARRWIAEQPLLDSGRIYLACLSNGGLGLMRAAIEHPEAYCGLISISGVLRLDQVRSAEFAAGWAGRSMLVLQGQADDRVREEHVRAAVDEMTLRGIRTTYRVWPNEDHFLLFSARNEVIQAIDQWLPSESR